MDIGLQLVKEEATRPSIIDCEQVVVEDGGVQEGEGRAERKGVEGAVTGRNREDGEFEEKS